MNLECMHLENRLVKKRVRVNFKINFFPLLSKQTHIFKHTLWQCLFSSYNVDKLLQENC